MSQLDTLVALHACVTRAGHAANRLGLATDGQPSAEALDAHRVEILADVIDTLNAISAGLGETLLVAMYPLTDHRPF